MYAYVNKLQAPLTIIEGGKKGKRVRRGGDNPPSNPQSGTRLVDPIREIEDIINVEGYLQSLVDNASTEHKRKIYARNKLIFIIGTRSGFRISDVQKITWGLIFDSNGSFHDNPQNIYEQKTGKKRPFELIPSVRAAIMDYINIASPDITKRDEYIFWNRNKRYEVYSIGGNKGHVIDDPLIDVDSTKDSYDNYKHRGLSKKELECKIAYLEKMFLSYKVRQFHIAEDGISNFIKDFAAHCGLEGNFACRSLRKTYAYRKYIQIINKGYTALDAALAVMEDLNHSNVKMTFKYLGIRSGTEYIKLSEIWE